MEQEIDLKELLQIIRKRMWMLFVFPFVAMIISGLISFYVLQPTYEASTTVIVGDNKKVLLGEEIEYNDILANKQLVSTYSEIAKSRAVLDEVREGLKLSQSTDQLKGEVSVQMLKDTELIQITAKSGNAKEAAAIADATARVFCRKIVEIKNVDNVSVVEQAVIPMSPVGPNKMLNMVIGFVLGAMLALGIIFLIEFLDDTIKNKEDAVALLGLTVLGSIPKFGAKERKLMKQRNVWTNQLVSYHIPRSPVSEAFRMVRTNIQYTSLDQDIKSMVITSAGQGEGKSTIIANLAVTFAQAGKRVMVVDCDLRKPTQHEVFALDNSFGLTSVLVGEKKLMEVKQNFIDNLDVLTSGPLPPNPSEILGSQTFNNILDLLKSNYDLVLVDAPPAAVLTDATVLANLVDGVLVALHCGKVEKGAAVKIVESLQTVKAKILGSILNNVDIDYKQYYNYYQYYYNSDAPEAVTTLTEVASSKEGVAS